MNTNKEVIWLTRTALFLAVALVAQLIGMNIGGGIVGQLLTGSLVNMALIVAGCVVGLSSGCTIAVLSPLLAFTFGMMKFAPAIPIVMIANIIIVVLTSLTYTFLAKKYKDKLIFLNFLALLGMIFAAFCKCAFMWVSALYILPLFVAVPPPILASFSLPQAITGTIGGIIALPVIPNLLKVKRKN